MICCIYSKLLIGERLLFSNVIRQTNLAKLCISSQYLWLFRAVASAHAQLTLQSHSLKAGYTKKKNSFRVG